MTEQPVPDYLAAFRAIRDKLIGSGHEHDWDIIDTWRPEQTRPVHPRMQGSVPITFVLIICKNCHLPQTMELEGIWTTEQVRGQSEQQ